MASISCQHIYKIYPGATAPSVTDFNLEIQDKEFIIFVGPSGCGKSTLLRCLAGLEMPDSGTISVDGEDLTNTKAQKRNIGMVFQSYALFPNMTALENIAFGLKMAKMTPDVIEKRVKDAVAAVFDRGETVVDEPILYFYNPALVTSDFHESQIFVIEEGGHRFFAERSTR